LAGQPEASLLSTIQENPDIIGVDLLQIG
jgi:hypothetical protein